MKFFTDMHHHVKSERDKDEDDDLDDDRKSGVDMSHHHAYYSQHPMSMGYHHGHHAMKSEMDAISKNQTGSDCGVPIPASKPKIWSLADTAACKTPPPHSLLHPLSAGASWAYHQQQQTHPTGIQYNNNTIDPHLQLQQQQSQMHLQNPLQGQQQQQQHPQQVHPSQQIHQQQSHMMNTAQGNGTSVLGGMTMNAHQQQQQQMNGMSGTMNTFGANSQYSRYEGFLAAAGTHPTQQLQAAHQHPYINSNSNNNTLGSITPVTPNSTGHPTTPTLLQQQQNINSQTSNNQTMGFPEIQTGKSHIFEF